MTTDGGRAIAEWTSAAGKSGYDDLLIEDHRAADDVILNLFTALNRMKDERDGAISLMTTLVRERSRLRAHMAAKSRSAEPSNSLYRQVGLADDCPDFLPKAAQLAFRKQFHPDLHPVHQREGAERRFKASEAVFEEIKRLRSR